MAVGVQSVGTRTYQNSVTTKDFTFTVAAGTNLALVVTLNFGATVSNITVTWDQGGSNQAMTAVTTLRQMGNMSSVIFGLLNPAVGTNLTGRVSWTTSAEVFIAPVALTDVDQTNIATAFPHEAGFASFTNPGTVSLTSATDNIAIACQGSPVPQGTNTGTLIYDDHASGATMNAMAEYDAGAASVTIGSSGGSNTLAAVDVQAAAGGGGGNRRRRVLLGRAA